MEQKLRQALAECARQLYLKGWAPNHEGNCSVRLAHDRFLVTPSAVSKRLSTPESLLLVDAAGQVIRGKGKCFSEFALHAAVYAARPEVGAVVQAHPPTALGFSLARKALGRIEIPKMVISLGEEIPLVDFALPGSPAAKENLLARARTANTLLLAANGAICFGPDVELALLRMELVESYAQAKLAAERLGGAVPLNSEEFAGLLDKHRKSGLAAGEDPLRAIIREEVLAAGKK